MKTYIRQRIHLIFELAAIALLSLIPLIWFKPGYVIIGFDSGYPLDFITYFQQRIHTWLGTQVFGLDTTLWLGQLPFIAIPALLQHLGLSLADIQKCIFVFWFLSMSLSIYALVHHLYKKPKYAFIRLSTVVFYVVNFFLFSFWIQGEQTTFAAWTLLPLATLLSIRFFERELGIIKTAVLGNVSFLFFNAGGLIGFPLMGSTMAALVVSTGFYYILALKKREGLSFILRTTGLLIVSLGLFFPLNAYWLLPFFSQFAQNYSGQIIIAGGAQAAIGWTKFISENASFVNLIRLQGDSNWYGNPGFYFDAYLDNIVLVIASFVFPFFVFTSYWSVKQKREKKIVLLLLCIATIGIFLASGTHTPFGFVYTFLMEHLPGFVAFRSAFYKFDSLIYLSFAILYSVSVYNASRRISQKALRYLILGISIIFLFAYHAPFFDSRNFTFDKPFMSMVRVPDYVKEYGEYKRNESENYRSLILPPLNQYSMTAYDWKYLGPPLFPGLSDKPAVQNLTSGLNADEAYFVNSIYQSLREGNLEQFFKLAEIMDIHEILLTKDLSADGPEFIQESPDDYEKILKNSDQFHLTWQQGSWFVYTWEPKERSNRIFSTTSLTEYENFYTSNTPNIISKPGAFVLSNQVSNVAETLPVTSRIRYVTCISCVLSYTDYGADISLPASRVNPPSLLYALKRHIESVRLSSVPPGQKYDAYIGLTLKRLGEVRSLSSNISQNKSYTRSQIESWMKAIRDYQTYWEKLYTWVPSLRQEHNYRELFHIYKYAEFERDELRRIYAEIDMTSYKDIFAGLARVLWTVEYVTKDLEELFSPDNLGKKFLYLTDNHTPVYLEQGSLAADSEGRTVPLHIQTSNSYDPKNEDAAASLLVIRDSSPITTLEYSDRFIQKEFLRLTLQLPDNTYNCISREIDNYVWNKTYIVQANNPSSVHDRKFIVTFRKDERTEEISKGGFVIPDLITNIGKEGGIFRRHIQGNNHDIGADIFFCTSGPDPLTDFSDAHILEYKPPVLYTEQAYTNSLVTPDIDFRRISASEYLVSVRNARNPFVLGFSERYSPQWIAEYMDTDMPVASEQDHFIINGFANAWNVDRTGNYSVRIRFRSQKYFYSGLKISIFSVGILVLLCGYLLFRSIWRKN